MGKLLDAKMLRVVYGKAEALHGISLSVEKGEVVALIGANGAGKTSTMKVVSGLITRHEGEIWFQGQQIKKIPPYDRVKLGIAYVPEGRKVFSTLTVSQNLYLGAYTRSSKKEIARDMARVCAIFPTLKNKSGAPAGSLSGGEQQMLAVGRALMSNPKLLLMDEPSLGLSPLVVKDVARVITEISTNGVSVLLVEQNASLALSISSRAYVLELGSIVLDGPSAEVRNHESLMEAYLGM
jgi:branched-chain amino acid transport system ATP-binding protein